MSKLIRVAVICTDRDDFWNWKEQQGHHPHVIDTGRRYQVGNKIYHRISDPTDLCSLSIDVVESTHDAHQNPKYQEIMALAFANLNIPESEIEKKMLKITLNTIKQMKISDVKYIGIMKAKDWFGNERLAFIFPNDYVVCEWCDYDDGVNSHIEGMTTIGIVKDLKDAEILYNNRSLLPSQKFPSSGEIRKMADYYKNLEGPNGTDGSIYVYAGIDMVKTWLKERGLL